MRIHYVQKMFTIQQENVCSDIPNHAKSTKEKEYCGYKHEKDKDQHINVKEFITNHEQEISTIKNKVNQ